MKLLRLKINDPAGFRSLPCGFEHHFRSERTLQEELSNADSFAPFVCAGPNGSGKSNLLEILAAIFFQLELRRVRRSFLPEELQDEKLDFSPSEFELDYLIKVPTAYRKPTSPEYAKVNVWKKSGESVRFWWDNQGEFETEYNEIFEGGHADILLPEYILGYSSGENEILSLPFFKTRFIQYDKYWDSLARQDSYSGPPTTRLIYLDSTYSQAILLCNLLFQDKPTLQPFRNEVGIESLREFRIIIRRSIPITLDQFYQFDLLSEEEQQQKRNEIRAKRISEGLPDLDEKLYRDTILKNNRALIADEQNKDTYRLHITALLDGEENSTKPVAKLKRCATCWFEDETTDSLYLDYYVNEATKDAFKNNFEDALSLFQTLQVLLTLNLYTVSDNLKTGLYKSNSHYINETVPTLASDQRIMRFKNFYLTKQGAAKPMLLKELSDGEHQLLHSLGLCILFRNTNSLILLDEPETHFNPNWRASFISQLKSCLGDTEKKPEMLITTHSPFLISDSKPKKVFEFVKDPVTRHVKITPPSYNTFGASINLITMETFHKRATIGRSAYQILQELLSDPIKQNNPHELAKLIMDTMGDSIERTLAVQAVLTGSEFPSDTEEPK